MKYISDEIKSIKNQTALFLFPHPDDESVMAGGLLQRLAKNGFDVSVLILTKGERGQVHVNGRGKSVAQIRETELKNAVRHLDPKIKVEIWDEPDGRLKNEQEWQKRLAKKLESRRLGLLITYGPSGVTGHPDHIVVSEFLYRWQQQQTQVKLLWVTSNMYFRNRLLTRYNFLETVEPEYSLRLSYLELLVKMRAVLAHKSQGFRQKQSFWRLQLFNQLEYYAEPKKGKDYQFRFFPYEI